MTREESWEVEGTTLAILRQITALAMLSAFFASHRHCWRRDAGRWRCMRWNLRKTPIKHVARVVEGEADDLDYRCACLLAEMVGIDLEDG